ncbi:MAG: Peptidase M23B [Candidatus Woesebacteria bacterium GW2011_GWB1_38_8]|uniref:Peptidase M23B n=1 Tax=Candidatus Woesebacteria bacterium GW2011_GWB1_38_8 TaxID=1618570 RepID=A0A0G0KY09_9BACT|nr:MAG: Peptidase M23B [Candidatus Woesebacteria bacterium GW2011_GWB1_38_8]
MRKLILFSALGALLLALITPEVQVAAQSSNKDFAMPYPEFTIVGGCHPDAWGTNCALDVNSIPDSGPLYSPINGEVRAKGINDGFGNTYLVLRNGRWTVYMLHDKFNVEVGQQVVIGEKIGREASIGNSTGPHVHLSVFDRKKGVWVDPRDIVSVRLDGRGEVDQFDLKEVEWDTSTDPQPGELNEELKKLLEVEFVGIETEGLEKEQYQEPTRQLNSGSSTESINFPLVGGLFLVFLLGAALLTNGKTWPLGLMLIAAVAFVVFLLLTSSTGQREEIPQELTEKMVIEFPPLRQELDSPASLAEEVIFPDLESIEEVIRQPVGSATVRTPGVILPLADLLETDIPAEAKRNIEHRYAEIVDKSESAGYNPALTMAIWLEESGASDYGRYPTVADFGCIRFPRADFNSQLNCFLSLWGKYESTEQFRICRGEDNELSLREFLLIYEGGFGSCKADAFIAEPQFPKRIRNYYRLVTGRTDLDF